MAKQEQTTGRGSDLFATAIKTMLDRRAADDPLFAGVYKKENKSIEGCCNYIISEVRRMEVNALTDEEVLGMAVHYYDEGVKMHHCVYSNEYYKRDDALIFTVRQSNKRLATVEVDINALCVVQCRGKTNSKPPRYNDIIQMFESAMPKIAKSVKRKGYEI